MDSIELGSLRIAIIGSGPAGLTCATQLTSAGIKVIVFDELSEFGGMLAYGIPESRIPLRIVRERILEAKKRGIIFENKKIVSIKSLLKSSGGEFDFVVIAIGSGDGSYEGFVSNDNPNVLQALHFLSKTKLEKKVFFSRNERVGVIGGGNSAIDAALVSNQLGAKTTILYRRTEKEMPAMKSGIEEAKQVGVEFIYLINPIEYKNKKLICAKMELGRVDLSGRKKPVDTGDRIILEFDKIIFAIGQRHDLGWLEKEGIKVNGQIIEVDSNYRTSLERVYACGDCITGPKTIASATLTGIKTAKAILDEIKENKKTQLRFS